RLRRQRLLLSQARRAAAAHPTAHAAAWAAVATLSLVHRRGCPLIIMPVPAHAHLCAGRVPWHAQPSGRLLTSLRRMWPTGCASASLTALKRSRSGVLMLMAG